MPTVHFTSHLRLHLSCESMPVDGTTVAEVLQQVFVAEPKLRSYVLDDQGRVRHHVMIFVDNSPIGDRAAQSDALKPDSEVYVMQALSGG